MVHALKEAWRVLKQGATLVDLRPLCVDVPLEILTKVGSESAGLVDMRPEIEADENANSAIQAVVSDGLFARESQEYFNFAYYWRRFREFKYDLANRWKGEILLPAKVRNTAWNLFRAHQPEARLRLQIRMTLATYRKL
jgi:hypothetical protein